MREKKNLAWFHARCWLIVTWHGFHRTVSEALLAAHSLPPRTSPTLQLWTPQPHPARCTAHIVIKLSSGRVCCNGTLGFTLVNDHSTVPIVVMVLPRNSTSPNTFSLNIGTKSRLVQVRPTRVKIQKILLIIVLERKERRCLQDQRTWQIYRSERMR